MKKLYDMNEEEEFGCASAFNEDDGVQQPPEQIISGLGIEEMQDQAISEDIDDLLRQINSGTDEELKETLLRQEEERERYRQEEERRLKEIEDNYNKQRYEKEQALKAARLAKEEEERLALEAQNPSLLKKQQKQLKQEAKRAEKERKKQESLRLKEEKLTKKKEEEERKLVEKQQKENEALLEARRLLAEREEELKRKEQELAQKEAILLETQTNISENISTENISTNIEIDSISIEDNISENDIEFEVPDSLEENNEIIYQEEIDENIEDELIPDPIIDSIEENKENIDSIESIEIKEENTKENIRKSNSSKKQNFLSGFFNKKEKTSTIVKENIEEDIAEPDWKYIAIHDELTDMLNSRAYADDLKKLENTCAIVFFDVNNLKYVNDNFSHEDGNHLLKTIADNIQKEFGKEHSYRIGGDEFVVLIEKTNKNTSDMIQNKSSNIHNALNKVMKDSKNKIPYAVSIGYAIGDGKRPIEDIIKAADASMYRNKKAYKESHPEFEMRNKPASIKKVEERPPADHDELLTNEQKQLKNRIQENHKIVNENSTEKIVREIQKRSGEINAILIASPNFDHLFIIRDVDEFIQIVLEQESLIDYSYLYVVYDGGPQYYGSDEYYSEVTHIFEAITEGLMSGRFRNEKDIKAIKGINIFKNVFI